MTKTKFQVLDGLRGIAALVVLAFHYGEFAKPGGLLPHGYLAVDLFFVLSGVVIANAYEARLGAQMSAIDFIRARVKRLYPVYLIGLLIGLVAYLVLTGGSSLDKAAQSFGASAFFVPILTKTSTFLLNGAFWSLSLEMAINIAYAVVARHLTHLRLAAWLVAAGVALVVTAFANHGLSLGYIGATYIGGFVRVCFSFPLGIAIYRLYKAGAFNRLAHRRSLGLITAFPLLALVPTLSCNAVIDLGIVLIAFPVLTILGMMGTVEATQSRSYRALADISYPLYAIHLPIWIILVAVLGLSSLLTAMIAVPLSIVLAYAVMRWGDPALRTLLFDRTRFQLTQASA